MCFFFFHFYLYISSDESQKCYLAAQKGYRLGFLFSTAFKP